MLLVYCLLLFHENHSWHSISEGVIVLYCLFHRHSSPWATVCLWIYLSWKSSTLSALVTCKMEAEQPGSPFLSSLLLLKDAPVYLQPHFFFLVKFRSSCDLNFQLCWWFSHVYIQLLHSFGCFTRRTDSEQLFLLLPFILICISLVSAPHHSPSHPARNPQAVQTPSSPFIHIKSNITFSSQIYSLNQCHLFYCRAARVIHLKHTSDHVHPW